MIRFLSNLKIQQKLLLVFVILILLPLASYTYLSYVKISKLARQQTMQSADQVLRETTSELSYLTDSSINALDIVSLDRNINEMLAQNATNHPLPLQLRDYADMSAFMNTLQRNKDFYRVRLYVDDKFVYSDDHVNFFGLEQVSDESWLTRWSETNETVYWFLPLPADLGMADSPPIVSVSRTIWNLRNFAQKIAISRVDILQSTIVEKLASAKITSSGIVYLQNSRGEIIARTDPRLGIQGIPSKSLWSDFPEEQWSTAKIDTKSVLISHKPIDNSDWMLVSVIPLNEVLANIRSLRDQLLLILLIISVISYLLAYMVSKVSTKKIKQLIKRMRKVQSGDLNVIITRYDKDEFGELSENFNYMIVKLSELIEKQFQLGKALKNADLKTLQAQINPHFLYNSLDVINCIGIEHQVPEISSMVQSLTKYYKLGLSKGMDIVTVQNELEHVEYYVKIMNIRYTNAIDLEINIAKELLTCLIPKITLQPLVENAILHGILAKKEKCGTIQISGKLDHSIVRLYVADDGVGMDSDKLNRLLEQDDSTVNEGFGVKNTQERLRLTYGEAYGLTYRSEAGIGTQVEIRIPAPTDKGEL